MSRDAATVTELKRLMALDIPGFSVEPKQDSKLMRIAAVFVWLFNREFLTRYFTTVYPKVYSPRDRMDDANAVWQVLAHEWVHLRAIRKLTPAFHAFLYFLPASLAPLALLSLFAAGGDLLWLVNLAWLLLLAPIPAYFRMRDEWAAYRMTLAVEYWALGGVTAYTINHVTTQFVSSAYWYMWPFESWVRRQLYHEVAEIKKGAYDAQSPYKEVKGVIEDVWKKYTPV